MYPGYIGVKSVARIRGPVNLRLMPRTRRGRRRIAAPEFAFALCVLQVQLLEAKTEPKEQDGEEDGELENAFEHLYQCVLERSYVGVHRRERQQVDEREQEAEAVEAE